MQRIRFAAWVCGGLLGAACAIAPGALAAEAESPAAVLSGSGVTVTVDAGTGDLTSIRLNDAEEMASPHPAGSEKPYGYLEVVDLREHRRYNPLRVKSTISDWRVTGSGDGRELAFTQQYEGAPFQIVQSFRQTAAGLRWEATTRLLSGQELNRSVQVNFVLPLPVAWRFWGPSNLDVHRTDGFTPFRYIYSQTDSGPTDTILPLVGVWGRKGGAAIFSPPDVRKCQIAFEVFTQGLDDVGTGVFRRAEDLQTLQISHHMVGLRPGKDLTFAICIAATRPDWRAVLGHYVTSYPELFEPQPQVRKYEGCYGITTPLAWQGTEVRRGPRTRPAGSPGSQTRPSRPDRAGARAAQSRPGGRGWGWRLRGKEHLVAARATCVEVHGHFLEYGRYISDEVIDHPDLEFVCESSPAGKMTYAGNRKVFAEMMSLGIAPFPYFYNVHSDPKTIEKYFAADLMRDEKGEPIIQWEDEPSLVAQPDRPFGRNLLEQLRLLIKAYPEVPGFFVDNYSIQKIDFAHDDGVTMVHNRPSYDMNRNHQDVGTLCHQIAHQAGKLMMVNKLTTIESAKGVDMVLLEAGDAQALANLAFACVNRAMFPLDWRYPDRPSAAENCLQNLLIWGGTPYSRVDPTLEALNAYRPLTDALIGKRWVFDADPLTLPAGYEGQIFRIDPHAPHAGDVVVTVVNLEKSWKDARFAEDLAVIVRLPEAEQLTTATWLPVEASGDAPQICDFTRDGQAITVKLPPVGAAGVLRLSR
jgi:hypothetical protein